MLWPRDDGEVGSWYVIQDRSRKLSPPGDRRTGAKATLELVAHQGLAELAPVKR